MAIQNKEKIERNFTKNVEYRIKDSWNDPAFQDYGSDRILKYSDVGNLIKKYHLLFSEYGIQKGDKIALVGPNSTNWGIIFISVATYGAVIVPILPDFMPDDIVSIIEHSDSKIAVFAKSSFDKLSENNIKNIKIDIVDLDNKLILREVDPKFKEVYINFEEKFKSKYPKGVKKEEFELERIDKDEILEISYTSGTSGNSKGVMLSHHSIFMNAVYCIDVDYPLKERDKILAFLPMAHSYGCAIDFLLPFLTGCHNTFLTKLPSPQILIKALADVRPHHLLSVPLVLEKIFQNKIKPSINKPAIKFLTSIPGINKLIHKKICKSLLDTFGGRLYQVILGGAPLNPEVEDFFRKIKFPITVGYGMTECGPLISYVSHDKFKARSCGKIIRAMEARIDSEDGTKVAGEIQVRGEHVMKGYYKNLEATNEIFTKDGWLKTGDVGILDSDNHLFISGRCKSMLLGPSGQNIYPEEIEAVFITNKYIQECLAVQRKESSNITLLVYPNFDLEKDMGKLEEKLEAARKDLNKDLPAYMRVQNIEIREEEFLKTPKKTIKRFLYK
jgi:long-chain acyl-CoA synthetase